MEKVFVVGGYVQDDGDTTFSKILAEINGIYLLSLSFLPETAQSKGDNGLIYSQMVGDQYTLAEMNAHYTPCTASEAGFPEEKWRPKKWIIYHFIFSDGSFGDTAFDPQCDTDVFRLKSGNCYRTKEEALAARDAILAREV